MGDTFISKVMAFYTGPMAEILINCILSGPLFMFKIIRQGCHLSLLLLLLYILMVEHLVVAMRNNPFVLGLQIGNHHHEVSLYTDDLLLYIIFPLDYAAQCPRRTS